MDNIRISCNTCGKYFDRECKEIRRKKKQFGNDVRFFCSRSCSAKSNTYRGQGNINTLVANNRRDEYSSFKRFLRSAYNKRRGKDIDIDLPYLKELWGRQQGVCALTRLKMSLEPSYGNKTKQASLDRIDSSKGYIKGNVQYVVLPINLAKSTMSNEDILMWLGEIRDINTHVGVEA